MRKESQPPQPDERRTTRRAGSDRARAQHGARPGSTGDEPAGQDDRLIGAERLPRKGDEDLDE
jgi:hypothetical protein